MAFRHGLRLTSAAAAALLLGLIGVPSAVRAESSPDTWAHDMGPPDTGAFVDPCDAGPGVPLPDGCPAYSPPDACGPDVEPSDGGPPDGCGGSGGDGQPDVRPDTVATPDVPPTSDSATSLPDASNTPDTATAQRDTGTAGHGAAPADRGGCSVAAEGPDQAPWIGFALFLPWAARLRRRLWRS